MKTDFDVCFTENSPFLDKAVKERTAGEPGKEDNSHKTVGTWLEPAVLCVQNKDGAEL